MRGRNAPPNPGEHPICFEFLHDLHMRNRRVALGCEQRTRAERCEGRRAAQASQKRRTECHIGCDGERMAPCATGARFPPKFTSATAGLTPSGGQRRSRCPARARASTRRQTASADTGAGASAAARVVACEKVETASTPLWRARLAERHAGGSADNLPDRHAPPGYARGAPPLWTTAALAQTGAQAHRRSASPRELRG